MRAIRHRLRSLSTMLACTAFAFATLVARGDRSARGADDPPPAPRAPKLVGTVTTTFPVALQSLLDVDGDGAKDLVVIGVDGEVRVWHHAKGDAAEGPLEPTPSGTLVLPDPKRSLIAIADLLGTGRPQLIVLSRQGLFVHPVGTDRAFQRAGILVSKDTRLTLRTGRPRFADFVRDVNGDGRLDVLLPRPDTCELWLAGPSESATTPGAPTGDEALPVPVFRKAASVRVDVSRERSTEHAALSDVLESSFRIPGLRIADVNGDGRADLSVEDGKNHSFHLAREDGSLPVDPDVSVDLNIFEDTTPRADMKLGHTLAGSDDQRYETRDLSGDGIPDYVIAHRRKVWIFLGRKTGPQFTEPSQVLRVSEDVTALMLLRLGKDPLPDLLLLRVQVPTVATLLRGLVASWDIDIMALGYENGGAAGFGTDAKWKGTLAVRLPAILGVLKNPDELIQKFEDVSKRFRSGVNGDFDGDGKSDLALADAANGRVDVWYARGGGAKGASSSDGTGTDTNTVGGNADEDADENAIGEVFFGAEGRVWDLDRILGWLGSIADQNAARLTGGRAPDAQITLRPTQSAEFVACLAGNLDERVGDEIVLVYGLDDRRQIFEVWR